jgi:plasmid stabilization system protein ParE
MLIARRTAAAEADLQDIAFQIAVRDQRQVTADRVIEELIQQCEQLARNSKNVDLRYRSFRSR